MSASAGLRSSPGSKFPPSAFMSRMVSFPRHAAAQGGQRRYDETLHRLHFIRHARDLGFSVEDIRQLIALSEHPAMSCDTATEIAHHHLQQVEGKIARLRRIRSELKRMIEACGGGSVADCRILEAIGHEPAPKTKLRGVGGEVK